MERISVGDWITLFFGIIGILSTMIFALIKNHVMLQECVKKIEVIFQLINTMKDKR